LSGVLVVALLALAVFTILKTSSLNSDISDLQDTTATLEAATTTGGKDIEGEIDELSLSLKNLGPVCPRYRTRSPGWTSNLKVVIPKAFTPASKTTRRCPRTVSHSSTGLPSGRAAVATHLSKGPNDGVRSRWRVRSGGRWI
jgi:hypothetical protein